MSFFSPTTFMARRYLQAGRNNRFFSWISVLTIAGVAIGVAAMIVVWSVINGFEAELRKRFLAANAHIMAYSFPNGVTNYGSWERDIEKDFGAVVRGVSPFIHYETMARKDAMMHAVVIRGVDPALRDKVQSLSFVTKPPEALNSLQDEIRAAANHTALPQIPAAIVGSGLISLMDAKVGDVIELVQPEHGDLGTMKKFKIAGIYDSGLKQYDNRMILMSLATAQSFFNMGTRVTGLEIGLRDPSVSPRIADEMSEKYSLSIREWQSLNKPLFDAMETERIVILAITAMVAGVAGFNILTTIFVAVSQRQRDISILKAIGSTNGFILRLFVKQAIYVGVVGSAIGGILAAIISFGLEKYSSKIIDLPDLYLLAKLPMTYEWWVYASVCGASVATAMVAGFFPAYMASRVDPVDGFRGNQGAA